MPTLRFSIGVAVTSSSLNSTLPPGSGASRPAMMRSMVVLPQPDGPSSTTVSPPEIVIDRRSSARVPSAKVLAQSTSRIDVVSVVMTVPPPAQGPVFRRPPMRRAFSVAHPHWP